MEKILTSGKSFVDEYGRERLFFGFNVVDKADGKFGEKHFEFEFDDAFFKQFKACGFNILRLGFVWASVEPEPGKYDEAFLDEIGDILDRFHQENVYVFLDIHQDCYSSALHGDGAPAWATLTDKYKPRKPKFVWAESYFISRAVHRAFDNFWANKPYEGVGIQDRYAAMWEHLAKRFGDKPALFGFDFMNEPYPGTDGGKVFRKLINKTIRVTFFDPRIKKGRLIADALRKDRRIHVLDQYPAEVFSKIVSTGTKLIRKFDTEQYSPFLDKMAGAVRKVTDNGILFVDNSYWSNIGIPCSNKAIDVNGAREPKQCFSPHGYDLMVDTPAYKYASNSRVGGLFAEHRRTQERLDVPVLVGEWGGNAGGTEWLPHVEFLLETFESYKWSYTYWHYYKGLLDDPLAGTLVRPYPKAVTGTITAYGYNREACLFYLEYEQDHAFDEPTVIYLHKKPKEIRCDAAYRTEPVDGADAAHLIISTGPGKHRVEVLF